MKKQYWVYTWDMDRNEFTPQTGVRCGPYTLHELKLALQKLQNMGYSCHYSSSNADANDPSVLVCDYPYHHHPEVQKALMMRT